MFPDSKCNGCPEAFQTVEPSSALRLYFHAHPYGVRHPSQAVHPYPYG